MTEPPEQQWCEALRRALLAPQGRVALVLRLSRLRRPGPRRYHLCVAERILEVTADHCDGRVFRLSGGDVALVCRMPPALPPALALAHPRTLPHSFARLFRLDLPDDGAVATLWLLGTDGAAALAYAQAARASAPRTGTRAGARGDVPA